MAPRRLTALFVLAKLSQKAASTSRESAQEATSSHSRSARKPVASTTRFTPTDSS